MQAEAETPSGAGLPWWVWVGLAIVLLGILSPSVFQGRHVSSADLLSRHSPWNAAPEFESVTEPDGLYSDAVFYFDPWLEFTRRCIRDGDIPLRNPLSSLGAPFLANAQSAILSPFSLPYYLFPVRVAAWITAFLKLFLAGCGTALLARSLGRSAAASAVAGLGYALCGFVVFWLTYPLSSALVPLPFALLGVQWLGRRPVAGMLLIAGAVATAVLGGHPECAFQCGAVTAVFFVHRYRGADQPERRHLLLQFTAAGAVAGLLAAPQLLAFLDYVRESGALKVRTDPVFRTIRLAHPPALGSVWSGIGLCVLLYLAFRSLKAAAAHPRREGYVHETTRRSPLLRFGDLVLALLAGGFLAWYARGALLSGSWNLFPLLVDPHYYGTSDFADGANRYSGPINFIELNGAFLGAALLLLAWVSPALTDDRGRTFRFCFGMFLVCLLISADAPPFAQLLFLVPPFDITVNRRLLGVAALFGALLAAYGLDGLREWSREKARFTVCLLVALGTAVGTTLLSVNAAMLPDRVGAVGVPELLPRPLGTPAGHFTYPRAKSFLQGDRVSVEGFALSVEPLQRAWVRLVSRVDGTTLERELDVGLPGPIPVNETLRRYPRADRSGFQTELDLSGFPGGDADLDLRVVDADGVERSLLKLWVRVCRPRGFVRATWTVPLAVLALLLAVTAGARVRRFGIAGLITVAVGDLVLFAWQSVPQIPADQHFPPLSNLDDLHSNGRILAPLDILTANTHVAYDLASVHGRDVLETTRYRRLVDQARVTRAASPLSARLGFDLSGEMFPLLGVRRVLMPASVPVEPGEGRVLATGAGLNVVEPTAPPIRARYYPTFVRRNEDEKPIETLRRLESNALDTLVLPPAPVEAEGAVARAFDSGFDPLDVSLIHHGPDELEVLIESPEAGHLLITDLAFAGFRASIDGDEVAIDDGFDAFLTVHVPAAAAPRTVRLWYAPSHVRLGFWLMGAGMVAGLGILLQLRRGRARSVEHEPRDR